MKLVPVILPDENRDALEDEFLLSAGLNLIGGVEFTFANACGLLLGTLLD